MTSRFVRVTTTILVVYACLIGLTGLQMARMRSVLLPDQAIGYQAIVVSPPPGSSLARTDEVVRQVNDIALNTPGVRHTGPATGFDVTTNTVAPNVGTIFTSLPSLYGEHVPGIDAASMLPKLRAALAGIKDASLIVVNPPPVQGLGPAGDSPLILQDPAGLRPPALPQPPTDPCAPATPTQA